MQAARDGAVIWPLRPPHVLMGFFTLAANLGEPCAVTPGPLVPRHTGGQVLAAMQALADFVELLHLRASSSKPRGRQRRNSATRPPNTTMRQPANTLVASSRPMSNITPSSGPSAVPSPPMRA